MKKEKIIVYTDGGSRGNPGSAALGVVICNAKGDAVKKYGQELGVKTNNEAEYEALIFALRKMKLLYGNEKVGRMHVEIRMDSDLIVNQLNGEFKIENERLIPLFIAVWNLKIDFGEVVFRHIPREKNREADRLLNEVLDRPTQRSLV